MMDPVVPPLTSLFEPFLMYSGHNPFSVSVRNVMHLEEGLRCVMPLKRLLSHKFAGIGCLEIPSFL